MAIDCRGLFILCSVPVLINCATWIINDGGCFIYKNESEPIGSILLNLTAQADTVGNNVTIAITNNATSELVRVSHTFKSGGNNWTASVILKEELDRDYEPDERKLFFEAVEQDTLPGHPLTCTLKINDVNQHPPTFLNLPYHVVLPENANVSSVIFHNISTKDPDLANHVTFNMVPDPITDAMFRLEPDGGNGAKIILSKPLDFETRNSYTIKVLAADIDDLNSTADVVITVEDVQDTPPYFLVDVYRAAIKEEISPGSHVIQVHAEDGDRGDPNSVEYSIIKGNTTLFSINSTTGIITLVTKIDRDTPPATDNDGVFDLVVQAKELNTSLPQYGNVTATAHVYVSIQDINDHCPTFNEKTYTAFVREDTPNSTLIYFQGDGFMRVEDRDQGLNAKFQLKTQQNGMPFDLFSPSPANAFSEAFVLVRLMNNTRLKELVETQIVFQVIAQETNSKEKCNGTANVVLAVKRFIEPSTTPAPKLTSELTASDIVVFVICFLIFLNILTSVIVCYLVKTRTTRERIGLTRHGSKYYMRQSNVSFQNGSQPEMTEIVPETSVTPRGNRFDVTDKI